MKRSGSSAFRTTLARLTLRGFAALPLPLARRIGAGLGWIGWRLNTQSVQVTRTNLACCLGLEGEALERMSCRSFMHAGRSAAEMGAMFLWPPKRLLDTIEAVEGETILKEAIAKGRGVVVLLPHIGNWELMGPYLAQKGELIALYRPPREKGLEPVIKTARERCGMRTVAATQRGMVQLFRTLEQGALTVILPDQQPKNQSGGVFAPFFNHAAHTPTLATRMVQKTGATAIGAAVIRSDWGFRLHFFPPDEGFFSEDPVHSATGLNRTIEHAISLAPEQYNWSYKRFRRRPHGAAKLY